MLVSRECPDLLDLLVTVDLLDPTDPLDPEDPPDLMDPLARTVELVVMEPSVPLVLVDPLDTSDLVVPPDLLVCPDLPALLVAATTSLDTMSTEPTSLP